MPQDNPTIGEDLEVRYSIVEDLIAQGLQKRHIVRWIQDHNADLKWNLSDRQLRNYYDTVMQRMSEMAGKLDRRMYHVRSLQRLDYLYRTAVEVGDRKNALAAEREIINLLKLDSPGADMDWREAAQKAGIDPDNVLARILSAHAELSADE